MAKVINMNPELRNLPKDEKKTILDNDTIQYCEVDLIQHIDDGHIIKRMAIELSKVTAIKPSSIMLAGIGVYSALLCRILTTQRNGRPIPLNGYYVLEQPTATAKTRILSTFKQPFDVAYRDKKKELRKRQVESSGDKEKESEAAMLMDSFMGFLKTTGITNATPEGIEKHLDRSKGYFSCMSSEQGLFDSLIGCAYKSDDKKQNNDLVLSAFDGAEMKVLRVGREAYDGDPIGAIVLFAQDGSVDTLLKSSGVSGMGERFTKLAERHRFGEEIEIRGICADIYADYEQSCRNLYESYLDNNDFQSQKPFYMLPSLTISNSDHVAITDFYKELLEEFDDGKRYSNAGMRGFCGKADIHIIKMASTLHVMESGLFESQIDSKHIKSSILIYRDLIKAHELLLDKKGVTGDKAAYQAIIKILGNAKKTRTEIKQHIRNVLPFKAFSGDKNEYMNTTLDNMLELSMIAIEIELPSGRELYSIKK